MGGSAPGKEAAGAHLPGHVRYPHEAQAQDDPRPGKTCMPIPPCALMPIHSPACRFSVMHIPTMQLLGCNRQSLKL